MRGVDRPGRRRASPAPAPTPAAAAPVTTWTVFGPTADAPVSAQVGLDDDGALSFAVSRRGTAVLKYDNRNNTGVDAQTRYKAMGDALKATGRPVLHSICEWGINRPWNRAPDMGDAWRTTGDINDTWAKTLENTHENQPRAQYAKPGAWNDPDRLEVGNGGMSDTGYRTHFSLWEQMAAPRSSAQASAPRARRR